MPQAHQKPTAQRGRVPGLGKPIASPASNKLHVSEPGLESRNCRNHAILGLEYERSSLRGGAYLRGGDDVSSHENVRQLCETDIHVDGCGRATYS